MNALPIDVIEADPDTAANDATPPWDEVSARPVTLPMVELAQPGDGPATQADAEVVDRAEISGGTSLIKLSKSEKMLADLAADHAQMPYDKVGTDKDAEQQVRQFRIKCSASRTWLKENCLALRKPARDFASKVIAAEEIIREQIEQIEKVGDELLKKIDEAKKAEKLRKEAEAAEEKARVDTAINAIRGAVNLMAGKPSAEIAEQIATVQQIEPSTETFGDRAGEALEVKMDTLSMLERMRDNAAHMERQQKEIADGQARLAKSQAEQRAIDDIGKAALRVMGKPAADIAVMIEEIDAIDVMDDVFGERGDEALQAQRSVLESLRAMHDNAVQAEERQAQQAALAQQLADQAAEQTRRQAEIDKADRERKEREEAEQAERDARAKRIQARLDSIGDSVIECVDAGGSFIIESTIARFKSWAVGPDEFGTRTNEAIDAIAEGLTALEAMLVGAREAEAAEARRTEEERAERQRAFDAAALAAAVAAASSEMFDVLCQWQVAEQRDDADELACAKSNRDEIIARVKAPQQ